MYIMKIAIFGGSFNPIHKGHISLAEEAIKELNLDKLYFVPAYKSPFKSVKEYAPAQDRVNMIDLVKPEKSEVSMFEINRKGTSYTIDTLKYFKNKHKDDEIFLLIGTDNLYKLHKWRDIDEIASLAKIVIFRREGNWSKENIKRFNCKLLNNSLYKFSSTKYRQGYMNHADDRVKSYIGENHLYIKDLMVGMLDPKRHKHSMSVANYAAKYAKSINADAKKAFTAGCLHDITKLWTEEQHREFLRSLNIDDSNIESFELHAITGYHWVKNEYMLTDEEILNAIKLHTTLDFELSPMDKIIFAADKLCEGRKHDGIQKDRELIMKNFDEGFKKIVNVAYEILIKNRDISETQEKIYRKWMGE